MFIMEWSAFGKAHGNLCLVESCTQTIKGCNCIFRFCEALFQVLDLYFHSLSFSSVTILS